MILQQIGNRGMPIGELFDIAAARHPHNVVALDHDLLVTPSSGRRFTVRELALLVEGISERFAAGGIAPGDHVAVYHRNGFDIVLLACAIARIGAVPIMLSPFLDGSTVDAMLRRTERPWLVSDGLTCSAANHLTVNYRTILTDVDITGAQALKNRTSVPRVRPVRCDPDDPAFITHTSGTTGIPKMAIHTRRSLQARYRPQAVGVGVVRKREPTAINVSFVHSRMYSALTIALRRGFPVLIMSGSATIEETAHQLGVFQPGIIEAHPNAFMDWETIAGDPNKPFANVKYFSSTFDALHPRTIDLLLSASRRRFPLFAQLYGQSETGPIVARSYTRRRPKASDARCVGIPFPGMTDVRVVPRNGRPPSRQNPGWIEVRSAGRAVDYLGEPKRYAEMVTGDWWRMGDVGYTTRRGCLHLLDREIDVIDGVSSVLEAEDNLLQRLPELAEVVIVRGKDGIAQPIVCTRDDIPINIERWTRASADLGRFAPPIQRNRKSLPHTATDKVRRIELSGAIDEPPSTASE